jgi:hypothetical protein
MDSYRDFAARWRKNCPEQVISEHLCPNGGFVDDGVLLIEADQPKRHVWVLASIISSGVGRESADSARWIQISFCPFCGGRPDGDEAFSRSARV